jgi:hypothetical protein
MFSFEDRDTLPSGSVTIIMVTHAMGIGRVERAEVLINATRD